MTANASDASTSNSAATAAIDPAIFIARGLDVGPTGQGTLSGRSFAVKDNIDVAGYPTTAACPDFAYTPQRSAFVVERLLSAGATATGKTNLDQFACGLVGTRSPYGAVKNAFDPLYVSGGSSSGSAVAVALGLVDFALGTDTAGSGRVPAGFNNIVGLKPTRGLLSSEGMLPACRSIDCISIFARTVDEALDVLEVAAGFDPNDPWSRPLTLSAPSSSSRFTFAVPDAKHLEFFGDEAASASFAHAVALLESLGGNCRVVDFTPFAAAANALYEDAWVAERYAAIREFFDSHAESIHPVVRTIVEQGRGYSAADLFDATTRMAKWRRDAAAMWADVDVLVVPTAPTIHKIADVLADPIALNRQLGTYTNAVNLLDCAAIAVPTSFRPDGLPSGITLIGPAASDLRIAALGARVHHASGLTLGTSKIPVPAPRVRSAPKPSTVLVAAVGAHMDGLPLNGQLRERGARLVETVRTTPDYRFYALAGTVPAKPGLIRVAEGTGAAIEAEIWEMPVEHYGSFVALIPTPLGIGSIRLQDGRSVQGFVCESAALDGATDITAHGGWRAWLAHQAARSK